MEHFHCEIWNKSKDSVEDATICIDFENTYELVITTESGSKWIAKSSNPLSALNTIREQMELEGLYPLCCGARLDVAVSGMAKGSRATRKVYKLELGKQATLEDLVDIFDPTNKEDVASLQDQQKFYQLWINSLK